MCLYQKHLDYVEIKENICYNEILSYDDLDNLSTAGD